MNAGDGFYVGYLPAPAGHSRAARWFAAAVVVGLAVLGGALAVSQGPVGEGVWDDTGSSTLTGTLVLDPYPRLITTDHDGEPLDVVLVEQGKIGAGDRARPFGGTRVTVRGGLIRWGGKAVLELTGATSDFEAAGGEAASLGHQSKGREVLEGEIVDPKCWLGVMNPGRGKPHLSCAELCIRGGIPPVLMVREPGRAEGRCLLMTTPEGGAANEMVRGLIGFRVRVEGDVIGGGWESIRVMSVRRAD